MEPLSEREMWVDVQFNTGHGVGHLFRPVAHLDVYVVETLMCTLVTLTRLHVVALIRLHVIVAEHLVRHPRPVVGQLTGFVEQLLALPVVHVQHLRLPLFVAEPPEPVEVLELFRAHPILLAGRGLDILYILLVVCYHVGLILEVNFY